MSQAQEAQRPTQPDTLASPTLDTVGKKKVTFT